MSFRVLTDAEKNHLVKTADNHVVRNAITERLVGRSGNIKVAYKDDGNFQTAIILVGKFMFIGTSKRNPMDNPNPELGKKIALGRALISEPLRV